MSVALFPATSAALGTVALLVTLLLIYALAQVVDGRSDIVVLAWCTFYPLGYYFLSFPHKKTIITLDRVSGALLVLSVLFACKDQLGRIPRELQKASLLWAGFLVESGVSVIWWWSGDTAPLRVLLDGFVLPAIMACCVILNVRVRSNSAALHSAICLMSTYLAGICVAEIFVGRDLMPLSDYSDQFGIGPVVRANGPFQSNTTPAVVGLINLFFLIFLRRLLPARQSALRSFLHWEGLMASMIAALAPLHRGTIFTLCIIAFLELRAGKLVPLRWKRVASLVPICCILLAVRLMPSDAYENRVLDPGNIYARLAQLRQNWEVFVDHPVSGVGFDHFGSFVSSQGDYATSLNDIDAIGAPHSNIGQILTETGLLGLVCYMGSQLLMVNFFRRLARSTVPEISAAWSFFLYAFLAYSIMGLDFASGYYGELNVWYVFVLAVALRVALTSSGAHIVAKRCELTKYISGTASAQRALVVNGETLIRARAMSRSRMHGC